jgi:hypothetical protein
MGWTTNITLLIHMDRTVSKAESDSPVGIVIIKDKVLLRKYAKEGKKESGP